MSVITYESLALNWDPKSKRDHSFNLIAAFVLTGFFVAGFFMGTFDLPVEQRKIKIDVPERVAKFILDRPKPKPKLKKVEPPKPKPKPRARIERQKPKKKIKLTKKQEVARKKAEQSGLLALSRELSDLIDTSSIDAMVGNRVSKSGKSNQVAMVNTGNLTKGATKGSSGISGKANLLSAGKTKLNDQQRAITRKLITSRAVKSGTHSKNNTLTGRSRVGNYRSEEDIAYVMDKNKSKLHAIYRRARRYNPGLKGKIVLEITILPSGKVSAVIIKSSELNDPSLETSLVARIKQFNFGIQNVKSVTVTLPVEFLPS